MALRGGSEMDDKELLGYADTHSETERALFSREHVIRILTLAGERVPFAIPEWVSVSADTMKPLVVKARRRLSQPGPYSGTGRSCDDEQVQLGDEAHD